MLEVAEIDLLMKENDIGVFESNSGDEGDDTLTAYYSENESDPEVDSDDDSYMHLNLPIKQFRNSGIGFFWFF
ncbi:hypothetical protein E2562_007943 [Oryza meyeriana var. granulata]|uniref:Uncharacterized protein n=1 Tax=Oryza meyeriana var. granulata TaxID=110450 RepID=A0A6G1DEB4_9ORYZ|nr:hypothetical protein E2562_007943 [Oryza meyeriana var. granulata]